MALCRATYATESNAQSLETAKREQDFLINHLHQQMHAQQTALDLYAAQLVTQVSASGPPTDPLLLLQPASCGFHTVLEPAALTGCRCTCQLCVQQGRSIRSTCSECSMPGRTSRQCGKYAFKIPTVHMYREPCS